MLAGDALVRSRVIARPAVVSVSADAAGWFEGSSVDPAALGRQMRVAVL